MKEPVKLDINFFKRYGYKHKCAECGILEHTSKYLVLRGALVINYCCTNGHFGKVIVSFGSNSLDHMDIHSFEIQHSI